MEEKIIYACSDLHVSPEYISDQVKAFLEEAVAKDNTFVLLCGDIFEGTHYKLEDSLVSDKGRELLRIILKKETLDDLIVIRGNHDWTLQNCFENQEIIDALCKDPDLEPHFRDGSPIVVRDNWEATLHGKRFYATHGWAEYDRPYGWMKGFYHHVVPRLARASELKRGISEFFRLIRLLHLFLPGSLKRGAQTSKGLRKKIFERLYIRRERRMSTRAILAARKNKYIPIWGHTHRRHVDFYEEWAAICCGDFAEDDIGGIVIADGQVKLWERAGEIATYDLPKTLTAAHSPAP
jgi:UDP-2,3-diacylglucosamine pyrophosphatase LpxH